MIVPFSWVTSYFSFRLQFLISELGCNSCVLDSFQCCFPPALWHCWLGDRKGIWPVKKVGVGLLVVTLWLELCTSYSSICHHIIGFVVCMRSFAFLYVSVLYVWDFIIIIIVIITTSIIPISNKIQSGVILVPANPGPSQCCASLVMWDLFGTWERFWPLLVCIGLHGESQQGFLCPSSLA